MAVKEGCSDVCGVVVGCGVVIYGVVIYVVVEVVGAIVVISPILYG